MDLNAELMKCDDFVSTSLPQKERQYVSLDIPGITARIDILLFKIRFCGIGPSHGVYADFECPTSLSSNVIWYQENHAKYTCPSAKYQGTHDRPTKHGIRESETLLLSLLFVATGKFLRRTFHLEVNSRI